MAVNATTLSYCRHDFRRSNHAMVVIRVRPGKGTYRDIGFPIIYCDTYKIPDFLPPQIGPISRPHFRGRIPWLSVSLESEKWYSLSRLLGAQHMGECVLRSRYSYLYV